MKETIFIRKDSDPWDEPCDVAGTPLRKKGSTGKNPAAFAGMLKGEHAPSDVIVYAYIDPATAWAWLDEQGFEPILAENSVGD